MSLRTSAIVAFGSVWFVVTGFLWFAALVAGGYTAPGLILLLIVPYATYAWIWRQHKSPVAARLLGLTVGAMIVASSLLFLWERGYLK